MNKRQKENLQNQLKAEEAELKQLKEIYAEALKQIEENIALLLGRDDADMQHVIYRVEYQKALKKQISAVLDELNAKQFKSIADYTAYCYENGFISTMYDIAGQGIPIITPLDKEQIVDAMKHDTKISEGLYTRLGKDVDVLKRDISDTVSRGIASGLGYSEIARDVAAVGKISRNKAVRIAQTEGARVYNTASYNAQKKAKEKGANIVKQWNATLDGKTRPSHRRVDGEIRELDEKFSNGLMHPCHPSGKAGEVINCRCSLMQRAVWNLDEEELETLKKRAEYFGLDKTENFDDFKKKYLKAAAE